MYCTKCGNKLSDDMKFCTKCGQPVPKPEPVQPKQEPVQPEPVQPVVRTKPVQQNQAIPTAQNNSIPKKKKSKLPLVFVVIVGVILGGSTLYNAGYLDEYIPEDGAIAGVISYFTGDSNDEDDDDEINDKDDNDRTAKGDSIEETSDQLATEELTTEELTTEEPTTVEETTEEETTEETTTYKKCPYKYEQKVVVAADSGSSVGTMTLYNWTEGKWRKVKGCSFTCTVGKDGISSNYGENISATPKGIWKLGKVLTEYVQDTNMEQYFVTSNTGIESDISSPNYNTICEGGSKLDPSGSNIINGGYNALIFIEHNGDGESAGVGGKGSAITICGSEQGIKATYGCIDINAGDMLTLLAKLDIEKNPYIEIKVN